MELSELSSTQSSSQQIIFVNAEGKPLKVNLQAVELEGRPKLVRALKGSGALVVSNSKEAVIILVDSATESGKRLIRTWGHDDSKVVLEHTWVWASTNLGRPLLEADNWGGSMTVDDGKPVTIDGVVVDEDELDEVEALVTKSPLPTPRVTPVGPTSQRSEITTEPLDVTRLASRHSTSTPNVTEQLRPGPPIAQPPIVNITPSDQTRMLMNPHNDIHPQQSPPPPPATQPLPYLQSTMMSVQPPQSQNTYAFAPFNPQHSYPSSQTQIMPTQPFPHAGFPPSQPQITHAPRLPHSPLPSSQPPATQPAPNMDVTSGANLQNPNFATIMTIMEVVRHMDQSSWFGQNQLPPSQFSQPPTNSTVSTFPVQPPATSGPAPSASTFQQAGRFESPGVDVSVPSSQDYLSDATASSWKHSSGRKTSEGFSAIRKSRVKSTRRPSDEMPTPSISRKRPSAVKSANPPKRLRKGKERAPSPYFSEHSKADESIAVSEDSYPTNSPNSPPERLLDITEHKKYGDIFLSESGQPFRFFVQVDLHGRHAVVTNIKKNRGKIVNNIGDADYLILSPRSDTFQGLLSEANALGKSPILAAFVADCVEEGALLDESDYILDSVSKVKPIKRGRQSVFSMQTETSETFSPQIKRARPKSSPAISEDKRSKETPSKASTHNNSTKKLQSTPSKAKVEAGEVPPGSCSPTPPPASARQEMRTGKYLFTRAEDEYILCLAKHHLNRDPTMTNNGLVCKLHQKMPHHTAGSWATHIEQKLKSAIEDVRKRANIAKRKRDSEPTTQNLSQGLINEGTSSKGYGFGLGETNGEVSMYSSEAFQENLERQDFEVITQFFASGGGDDDNDERVWQELEKYRPCRSSTSWPEYYAAHQQEVYTRIEEMMNE